MKVAVISRHYIINYGSLLQTLATQEVIRQLGHDPIIIDYVRFDEHFSRVERANIQLKPHYNNNVIKRCIYLMLREPENVVAGKKFFKERKKYLNLSDYYEFFDELKNKPPLADVYITGSDQVWGPMAAGAYDPAYFLSFLDNEKRVAYAASFGRTQKEFSQKVIESFKDWLGKYSTVLVREISAQTLCTDIGIDSKIVLDPTLLLSAKEWRRVLSIRDSLISQKYVMVYQVHNDKRLNRYAIKYAKEHKMLLVRVSPFLHQMTRGGKFVYCPTISDFVNLLSHATCLITDSFHGTAFAINFNVPFIEVMPNNSTGTRNESILDLCGLKDRILINDDDVAEKPIDFSTANNFLEKQRQICREEMRREIEE